MTKEDLELLITDLCGRLRYGIKVKYRRRTEWVKAIGKFGEVQFEGYNNELFPAWFPAEEIKPILRPISDMTDSECDELFRILSISGDDEDPGEWIKINDIGILRLYTENGKDFYELAEALDYLNSIHVDYRGLIELGLGTAGRMKDYEKEEK